MLKNVELLNFHEQIRRLYQYDLKCSQLRFQWQQGMYQGLLAISLNL